MEDGSGLDEDPPSRGPLNDEDQIEGHTQSASKRQSGGSRSPSTEPLDTKRAKESKTKLKSHRSEKKKKKKKRSKKAERSASPEGKQPVQLSKHLHGDSGKYSSITGSKIKLKVEKTKADKEEDHKRRKLLDFLNSSYE